MPVYASKSRRIGPLQHIAFIALTVLVGGAGITGFVLLIMMWTLDQAQPSAHHGHRAWNLVSTQPR